MSINVKKVSIVSFSNNNEDSDLTSRNLKKIIFKVIILSVYAHQKTATFI